MDILYKSTRGGNEAVTASRAIVKGLADDGGLYMPDVIPALDIPLDRLKDMTYREIAFAVMRLYLTDFTDEELKSCIEAAYDDKFDSPDIAPLHKADDAYFLELFHGPTIAFKDMALSILPHLLTVSAKKNHITDTIVILTATSGDTGKAALSGFADVKGTRIIVFYPRDGVSRVQKLQMVTQKGENVSVVALRDNFDAAQTAVKEVFNDRAFQKEMAKEGYRFSSANSINIGRLVPQIVYYVYAYARLCADGEIKEGEIIDIAVPTGNFGNILSAYFAKLMGLPVGKLLCASNKNKVLFDFFNSGVYDSEREFFVTSSPSMDILISSNLERLLYMASGRDVDVTRDLMRRLKENGKYSVPESLKSNLSDFVAGYAGEEEVKRTIADIYDEYGYVIDPHTAVAANVWRKYHASDTSWRKTVIASTASPYKFSGTVVEAIENPAPRPGAEETPGVKIMSRAEEADTDDFQMADALRELSGTPVPAAIRELNKLPIRHRSECDPGQVEDVIRKILTS